MKPFLIALFIFLFPITAIALDSPHEQLDNPLLEKRAEALGQQLRCLVCQNESIEDSSAPLARDLRHIVREQIQQGRSDDEIMQWMTQRYGDFILLKPLFKLSTALLWFMPLLALIIGSLSAWRFWHRPRTKLQALTPQEKEQLERLLKKE
ncbi:cytochrome c-type biogenesis protein CcmH [Aristophania vespae]|uniref:Cytochrome c-type biogenesis protein n=1 Tax=Aristophania vespae TaxID=2697033 RepID=A0A6P1NHU1_9PROT|nr:cytochrome c-type biogenesis protein [Aristophania vespae]QHI95222.1 cytochrome c-type biogenesis protein CcmH [Aristophania vespae]UMM64458.1 hypothetical protein DM15PD_14720 [Aristophania vespae]